MAGAGARRGGRQQAAYVQAMLHVAQCLLTLHKAGFVHRDVKPGSIIWLPSEHRWALVNFCRACRPGATAPAPSSLAYAAPEVAACVGGVAGVGGVGATASGAGASVLAASPAADAWALGVVVYELFSRQRALDVRSHGVERVRRQSRCSCSMPQHASTRVKGIFWLDTCHAIVQCSGSCVTRASKFHIQRYTMSIVSQAMGCGHTSRVVSHACRCLHGMLWLAL